MTDFRIANHGSIVMVEPVTQPAKQWVEDNVQLEGWQWMGPAFSCDPRMVDNLVAGIEADGLSVEG